MVREGQQILIHSHNFKELAENILTIRGVLDEIKNKRQIKRLVVLPFDVEVREPTPESVRVVVDFARKTGDFASLSAVDLKVVALTYELEKEHVGTDHLRKEPVMAKTIIRQFGAKLPEISSEGFFPKTLNAAEDGAAVESKETNETAEDQETIDDAAFERELAEKFGKLNTETEEGDENEDQDGHEEEEEEQFEDEVKPEDLLKKVEVGDESEEAADEQNSQEENEEEEEDSDDGGGWITPSNVKVVKREMSKDVKEEKPVAVACMTTDFSVQNVCKQMGLNLSAIDGRVIREARTFILRCYTCFRTTTLVHKIFCPKCGHKTMKRCAVSIDEHGQQTIHINMRKPITAKGKNKSLPHFKGGKHSANPIIFEDQQIPKQMPSRVARTKTSALDEDYIAGYSPFVRRDVDSRSALLRTKGSIRDMMRNHEYQTTRRAKKVNVNNPV